MPIFTEIILLLRQNTIPYGQGIINAFDQMELCLVINLTKGGIWAITRPPIFTPGYVSFATTLNTWTQLFKTNDIFKVLLKFQTLISEICQYFLLKVCEKLLHCKSFSHFFSTKNFSIFGYKVIKHLMI